MRRVCIASFLNLLLSRYGFSPISRVHHFLGQSIHFSEPSLLGLLYVCEPPINWHGYTSSMKDNCSMHAYLCRICDLYETSTQVCHVVLPLYTFIR